MREVMRDEDGVHVEYNGQHFVMTPGEFRKFKKDPDSVQFKQGFEKQ